MKKKILQKPKEIRNLSYSSLESLISELDNLGIKREDYKNIDLELDYEGVFYESDTPGIKAVIK